MMGLENVFGVVAQSVVNIFTAVLILVIGWIIALILSSGARKAVEKTKLNEYLDDLSEEEKTDEPSKLKSLKLEDWAGKIVFYVVMFFVLIAIFQSLQLTIVAEPFSQLLSRVFSYIPMIVGALALLLIAIVLANIIRALVFKVLKASKIDEKFDQEAEMEERDKRFSPAQLVSRISYWIVILLFIPAILTSLQLEGILQPVQDMTARALTFLPNIAWAAILLVGGWLLARILRQLVARILESIGTDHLSESVGLSQIIGDHKISRLSGSLVYALVMIVAVISALNALQLDYITDPASNMLQMILSALPAIFAAFLVIAITYAVARIVRELVTNILHTAGFDRILMSLGLTEKEDFKGRWTPSESVSYVLFTIIMLFATIEAAELLNFNQFAGLISQLLVFIAQIALGLAIFAIALYLANLAHNAIKISDSPQQDILAKLAKYAIIVLGASMALERMGLADEIIVLAFGIILAGIVVTGILAFGLGGKEIAQRELENWLKRLRGESSEE